MVGEGSYIECQMKLLSDDRKKIGEAARYLKEWGCCIRCTVRFLGDKQIDTYRRPLEDLQSEIDQLQHEATQNNGAMLPEKKDTSSRKFACVACLGILEKSFSNEMFLSKIAKQVEEDDFEYDHFFLSIKLPVSILLREHAIWLTLRDTCKALYYGHSLEDFAALKEVWKWINSPLLEKKLGVPFSMKSSFDICMTFAHENVDRECHFLLDCFPNVFRRRKNNRVGWETYTRTNVSKAIQDLSEDKFKRCYTSPPAGTYLMSECKSIVCSHEAIFMAGRYNKYCRELPQSPWILNGVRKAESSVQELISDHITAITRASECRFSASGREDVDVRMLGQGRPFVFEVINPHKVTFSYEDLNKLQKEINKATTRVRVRDLQVVSREDTATLKEGEESKIKSYSALCWTDKEVSQEKLDELATIKELVLSQQTPIRVLHRRAVATRERTIHKMSASLLDTHHFRLQLWTQAGTYVKEFVHGDFGRTQPNLGQLLKAECDILELDVEAVELDWPPHIDYSDTVDT